MAVVGITFDEAMHGFGQQEHSAEELRAVMMETDAVIADLMVSYRSSATIAASDKWHSEARPKMEHVLASLDEKRDGGTRCVNHQQELQDSTAHSVMSA